MDKKVSDSLFTEEEIRGIREGIDGVKRAIPARFYHDEEIYQFEVEHLLKRNWLCVGRWDLVEKPGDYFTVRMFDEPVVIVRDREGELHALVNVCQHRWSQVVADGNGNASVFTCPYHNWSYNLDGSLRGMSVQPIPNVDIKKCSMPRLGIEEWHGFIFINFDSQAKPLAPQLKKLSPILEAYKVKDYRHKNDLEYEANWNWKFSFETGYEAYHHAGLHNERFNHIEPASGSRPYILDQLGGSYLVPFADDAPDEWKRPFGNPPGTPESAPPDVDKFVAVYPNLIMYLNNYQVTYLVVQHGGVTSNRGSTRQSIADWAMNSPAAEELLPLFTEFMTEVQDEDTLGCTMLQKGISSRTNQGSFIHPLEEQLNHYHNWYLDQMTNN